MFEKILGNAKNKELLNNISSPAHAYMFEGQDGIGKFLFAKEFANKFLCISDNKPCYKCKSCMQFINENNMDFKIISPIDDSIKINQIREIISKIHEKPILSDKKIYIINDADKMTVQAQNCLLKILEEPPLYVMIILVVSNEQLILNTIKSRCVKIRFENINDNELIDYFKNNGYPINENMIKMYNGSIGKAQILHKNSEKFMKIAEVFNKDSKIDFLKTSKEIYEEKEDVKSFLEYMNILFFDKCNSDIRYTKCIDKVNDILEKLKYNTNVEMAIDELLLEIWDLQKI